MGQSSQQPGPLEIISAHKITNTITAQAWPVEISTIPWSEGAWWNRKYDPCVSRFKKSAEGMNTSSTARDSAHHFETFADFVIWKNLSM